jgi:hypothetical protein
MRDLLKIVVSDSGEEIFVYGGNDELIMIRPVSDPDTVGNYVRGEIEDLAEGAE